MAYLYETHLHTVRSSACGVSRGQDYIHRYIDRGFSGIIVTDHFFRGNTAIDRRLPWREWVHRFCRGYEETREAGERLGLDVFFGWEETFDGCDDYLIYGLDKAWLLEHPESRRWTRGEQYREVKRYGGCVVQAHPFRQHYYISRINLSAGCVDGVEAANAGNHEQSYDALAARYAERLGLPKTAGSDIHDAEQFDWGEIFGVYLDKKLDSIAGYVRAIKEKNIAGLKTSEGRCDYSGNETVSLPVDIRNAKDRSTGQDLWEWMPPHRAKLDPQNLA
ncbi:MAG: PHP domain-containing protein [Treponema sp.]|nr:PHP domain-containing protein [Treponema sp.]